MHHGITTSSTSRQTRISQCLKLTAFLATLATEADAQHLPCWDKQLDSVTLRWQPLVDDTVNYVAFTSLVPKEYIGQPVPLRDVTAVEDGIVTGVIDQIDPTVTTYVVVAAVDGDSAIGNELAIKPVMRKCPGPDMRRLVDEMLQLNEQQYGLLQELKSLIPPD